ALLVGTIVSSWQAVEAHGARRHAEQQRQRAEQNATLARQGLDEVVTKVGDEGLKDAPRVEHIRHQRLQEAVRFDEASLQTESDPPAARQDLGKAYFRLGSMYGDLHQNDKARSAYQQAVAIQERLTAEHPDQTAYQEDLATSYHRLGWACKSVGQLEE